MLEQQSNEDLYYPPDTGMPGMQWLELFFLGPKNKSSKQYMKCKNKQKNPNIEKYKRKRKYFRFYLIPHNATSIRIATMFSFLNGR